MTLEACTSTIRSIVRRAWPASDTNRVMVAHVYPFNQHGRVCQERTRVTCPGAYMYRIAQCRRSDGAVCRFGKTRGVRLEQG